MDGLWVLGIIVLLIYLFTRKSRTNHYAGRRGWSPAGTRLRHQAPRGTTAAGAGKRGGPARPDPPKPVRPQPSCLADLVAPAQPRPETVDDADTGTGTGTRTASDD